MKKTKFVLSIATTLIFVLFSCAENPTENGDPPTFGIGGNSRFTDFEPSWSPDGKYIAYVHGDTLEGVSGIYIIDTSGVNKRKLETNSMAYTPSWSPDGKWIVFGDRGQIYKIKVNSDSLTQLTFEGSNYLPSWSPDGLWIAYDTSLDDPRGANVIWKMHNDGKNKVDISEHGVGEWRIPSWSPDGEHIVHQRYYDVSAPEIAIMDSSGKNSSRLTFDKESDSYPKYSPDGSQIAFTSKPSGKPPQIWKINTDGTNPKQLTDNQGYTCDWSPDGKKIVYTDSRLENGMLWIMDADGSNKKQLTFDNQF